MPERLFGIMKVSTDLSLGKLMTFELSKHQPLHGWFWYKEGFAPEIFEYTIGETKPNCILDPFCGVGTAMLAAKQRKINSVGVDASPLAVFISKTKTEDYSREDLEDARAFLFKERKAEGLDWEFELFDPRSAFPKRNYNQIMALRSAIENESPRVRNLLLLALLSILPQASLVMKDGGVLKIKKDKRALPAKEIFKRKVKKMVRELEGTPMGNVPRIFLGDARALDVPSESIDLVLTSPPYLNNIDYSKVYGLELSLLSMSKAMAQEVRMRAIRSFIGRQMEVEGMPPEVGDIGNKIPVIGTYFKDMELAILEMKRVMKTGSDAHIVVANSVIHETHILVDEILAQIADRIGFSDVEIIIGAHRIADVKPQKIKTRESIVKLTK
jgi:methylase of polypeptide subunit release factors